MGLRRDPSPLRVSAAGDRPSAFRGWRATCTSLVSCCLFFSMRPINWLGGWSGGELTIAGLSVAAVLGIIPAGSVSNRFLIARSGIVGVLVLIIVCLACLGPLLLVVGREIGRIQAVFIRVGLVFRRDLQAEARRGYDLAADFAHGTVAVGRLCIFGPGRVVDPEKHVARYRRRVVALIGRSVGVRSGFSGRPVCQPAGGVRHRPWRGSAAQDPAPRRRSCACPRFPPRGGPAPWAECRRPHARDGRDRRRARGRWRCRSGREHAPGAAPQKDRQPGTRVGRGSFGGVRPPERCHPVPGSPDGNRPRRRSRAGSRSGNRPAGTGCRRRAAWAFPHPGTFSSAAPEDLSAPTARLDRQRGQGARPRSRDPRYAPGRLRRCEARRSG